VLSVAVAAALSVALTVMSVADALSLVDCEPLWLLLPASLSVKLALPPVGTVSVADADIVADIDVESVAESLALPWLFDALSSRISSLLHAPSTTSSVASVAWIQQ